MCQTIQSYVEYFCIWNSEPCKLFIFETAMANRAVQKFPFTLLSWFQFWSFSSHHRCSSYPSTKCRQTNGLPGKFVKPERRNAWISRKTRRREPLQNSTHLSPREFPKVGGSVHEFLKLLSGFGFEFTARSYPSFQLSTADCSLISGGKHNSLFRKISCILVNWWVGARKVKKRVTMSRFQISCILVKWGGAREKGGRVTMSRWGRR